MSICTWHMDRRRPRPTGNGANLAVTGSTAMSICCSKLTALLMMLAIGDRPGPQADAEPADDGSCWPDVCMDPGMEAAAKLSIAAWSWWLLMRQASSPSRIWGAQAARMSSYVSLPSSATGSAASNCTAQSGPKLAKLQGSSAEWPCWDTAREAMPAWRSALILKLPGCTDPGAAVLLGVVICSAGNIMLPSSCRPSTQRITAEWRGLVAAAASTSSTCWIQAEKCSPARIREILAIAGCINDKDEAGLEELSSCCSGNGAGRATDADKTLACSHSFAACWWKHLSAAMSTGHHRRVTVPMPSRASASIPLESIRVCHAMEIAGPPAAPLLPELSPDVLAVATCWSACVCCSTSCGAMLRTSLQVAASVSLDHCSGRLPVISMKGGPCCSAVCGGVVCLTARVCKLACRLWTLLCSDSLVMTWHHTWCQWTPLCIGGSDWTHVSALKPRISSSPHTDKKLRSTGLSPKQGPIANPWCWYVPGSAAVAASRKPGAWASRR